MAKQKEVRVHTTWKNAFKRDWQLYLLVLIPLALVIIFNYACLPWVENGIHGLQAG